MSGGVILEEAIGLEPARWTRMSILNVARMSKFSSDRAIDEYASEIWHVSGKR